VLVCCSDPGASPANKCANGNTDAGADSLAHSLADCCPNASIDHETIPPDGVANPGADGANTMPNSATFPCDLVANTTCYSTAKAA
jgi:hypothetical protein